MARRALRKIDPSLELGRWLRTFDDLPAPWQPEAIFGRQAPLEVEVGTGKGLFLVAAAANAPDRDFLGMEVSNKYARYAAARLAKRGLTNACVVHGDALRVFRERLPDACLAAVHVYFPDPWWKARHKKRRVLNAGFLADVERTLSPGGRLHFWTDVQEYFRSTLDLIERVTRLEGLLEVPEHPAQHDLDYRTHFERRTRLSGEPVYRAEFARTPPMGYAFVTKETSMPPISSLVARDIMRSNLVTAAPGQSLADLRHLLIGSHVSGAPVVDRGKLVGIVSRSDLVRVEELVEALDAEVSEEVWLENQTDGFKHPAPQEFGGFHRRLSELKVKDAMREQVMTCSPDTPVAEVAAEMVRHHVHRIVVIEGDHPLGIVSTLDIAALVAQEHNGPR
ncbi:MAG: tRNA (guanosine(46)-N7)-methyltransferase TrmB [Planctomycetia bacterium 21-64-5]|nr:MAG: tRNA (guanosine(46)-N7)-methyltransferase TrmB [Planctomycetia bacterium 21-64-5]